MCENSFKFKNGELELEFSGERTFVEEQVNIWKNFIEGNFCMTGKSLDNNYINPDLEISPSPIKIKKNISIEDFLTLKAPENETDKTLVAAYYLERYEKFKFFTEQDIFKLINLQDADRFLAINMEKGFLSLFNKEKNISAYTLTYSGEIYVREGLQV